MSKFAKEVTNNINVKYRSTFFRRYVVVNPKQAMVEVGCNDEEYISAPKLHFLAFRLDKVY